jgi:Xaa-Pro aminopeptidase
MPEIVISEFMDEAAIREAFAGRDVLYDPQLVDDATRLHDAVRDAFLKAADHLRPGNHTGECTRIAYEHVKAAGVPAPEKLLTFAHGIGLTPVEMPVGFPSLGARGAQGFVIEEDMTISLDCLYFGGKHGPCHMENVYITGRGAPEATYAAPLVIGGPRDL